MRTSHGCGSARVPGMRVVVFGLMACALTLGQQCISSTPPDVGTPELASDDHVLKVGEPTVTVFEYGNFACSHCGTFARNVWPTIKAEYVDTGKVQWIVRHLPFTNASSASGVAAQASECAADQGAFYEYYEMVFDDQADLSVPTLESYADDLGLDTQTFDTCLESGAKEANIQQERDDAFELGIDATPYFFVNGEPYRGNRTLDQFRAILDAALGE